VCSVVRQVQQSSYLFKDSLSLLVEFMILKGSSIPTWISANVHQKLPTFRLQCCSLHQGTAMQYCNTGSLNTKTKKLTSRYKTSYSASVLHIYSLRFSAGLWFPVKWHKRFPSRHFYDSLFHMPLVDALQQTV